jgi:triacylglycerol lipase
MRRSLYQLVTGLLLAGSASAEAAPPGPAEPLRRVVLVHGFLETGSAFKTLRKRLEKRGIECFVPRLKPSDGRSGLENVAARLKQDIDAEFGSEASFSVVAFSMGGLVSRHYLQKLGGAPRCENFITISSPHHGTSAAWCYPTQGARQMRPSSEFLAELRASEDCLGNIPVTSYRTPMDLIILPPESSIWDRAENVEFVVLAHPLMLTSKRVLDDIEQRLLK